MRFQDIAISHKLSLIIVATSTVVLLLASTAFIVNDIYNIRKNLVNKLFTVADIVGLNMTASLVFDDNITAAETMASLNGEPQIMLGYVYRYDQLFAQYQRENVDSAELPTVEQIVNFIKNSNKAYRFTHNAVGVQRPIDLNGQHMGHVYVQADLSELNQRLMAAWQITLGILLISILISVLLARQIQKVITRPINSLVNTMRMVSKQKNYAIREDKRGSDEIGLLIDDFNNMLSQIQSRDQEINQLNTRLQQENLRMSTELDVTRQLQQMVLPKKTELENIEGLDIAGFMQPAEEVGGDYYDVLCHEGHVKIGIGDVTGHGLASGVLMLMVQMAVRTLLVNGVSDPKQFLNNLNRAIYENINRMESDKNLTLSLLDYEVGHLRFYGQHEEILLVRANKHIERINTLDLGFIIGLEPDIEDFIASAEVSLAAGDGVVLYTDGITEAQNEAKKFYELERLCQVVQDNWHLTAAEIQQMVIMDVIRHIGDANIHDDITLLVIKRV